LNGDQTWITATDRSPSAATDDASKEPVTEA
jgi:hypothetical protein